MQARLQAALDRAAEIERELADSATARNPAKLKTLGREHSRLERIRRVAAAYEKLVSELAEAQELLRDQDSGLADLAREEAATLQPQLEAAEQEHHADADGQADDGLLTQHHQQMHQIGGMRRLYVLVERRNQQGNRHRQ